MASKEREELLAEAQGVGLAVGVDFAKNIKSEELRTLIDNKKVELENQLKGKSNETNSEEQEIKDSLILTPIDEFGDDKDKLEKYGKTFGIDLDKRRDINIMYENLVTFVNESDEEQNETNSEEQETYEDEMLIKRISKCGNYRTKIIGLKEAARRSGVTEEEVKEALETGEQVSTGFTFKEI